MTTDNPYAPPKANLNENENSSSADALMALPRFGTLWVILLSIITLSLYYVYWLCHRTALINRYASNKIGMPFIVFALVVYFVSFVPIFIDEYVPAAYATEYIYIVNMLDVFSSLIMLIWVFRIRNRLIDDVYGPPYDRTAVGPILTFFFQIYYLQYTMNREIDNHLQDQDKNAEA